MRALTLKPHWAHAVAHLGKRCENRSTPIPLALLGQRVAIHAGAKLPTGWGWMRALLSASPEHLSIYQEAEPNPEVYPKAPGKPRRIRTRAIVATAVLGWQCRPDDTLTNENGPWSWLMWGDSAARYWWRLDDVRTLDEPIPWQRGQLGLWRLPDDVASVLA